MKTFNTQLIVPFIITLLLTGCMPDSLTKFNKDEATKKPTAVTATDGTTTVPPVVDSTGVPITFDEPTFFLWENASNQPQFLPINSAMTIKAFIDGSLGDTVKVGKFFERCDIETTGVNAQAVTLPTGISLTSSSTGCAFTGTPTAIKSVITAFCSDGVSIDQPTCEANPLVWDATTSTCSRPDFAYATAATCTAAFHKWHSVGGAIPYLVKMTYHNTAGTVKYIYSTFKLGTYKPLTTLNYTQSDKLLLKVTGSEPLANIIPLLTTTATVGAYAKNNIIISNFDVGSVAKFVDTTLNFIGVNKLVPIKVTSTTPFIVNTFITKSGDATKVGKIFKIDAANRILYVENISANNKYFIETESICSNSITGVCGTSYPILDISESYVFKAAQALDNDKQYYTSKYSLTTPVNVFEVGTTLKPLTPIASSEISSVNGITYSISPALPCNDPLDPSDCVSLDSSTGEISGTFSSALANTEFTLTATNPVGSVTTKVNLSAIIGPEDLSLTTKQIITVSSTSYFKEGETIIQPLSPPLTEALRAKIVKIINGYQLAIETFNGVFVPGASLDNNSSAFQSEKAYIIPYSTCTDTNYTTKVTCEAATFGWAPDSAIHYNISLTTNNSGDYVAGDYITSTAGTGSGAYGRVMHVFTAARDELFIQHLTQTATSTASAKTFYEGDTLNTGTTVYQVQNGTMIATVASAVSFLKGSDIVSNQSAAAYTHAVVGNVLYLSDISKTTSGVYFKIGDTLYNHETQTQSSANSAITAVTHNNYFIFERGKTMYATGNVSSGNGIIYSISPALPTGLFLDTTKGTIYGSATSSSTKKDYIVTATNFIGSTTFVVALEVKDYFEIIEKSGASSALLHKVGDYQVNRKCRVDATDIASLSNGKALDIRCFLDMEEQDIYQTNLKLNLFTGPGICQYIRYEPYFFYSFQPHQSLNVSTRYTSPTVLRTGCSNLSNSGEIPTIDMCEGNYSEFDPTYPNCDEGKLIYYTETYSQDSGSGACTLTQRVTTELLCSGKRANCIAGPVTDVISDANLILNKRNEIISSASGVDKTYEHASPISKGDAHINIRTSNATINNQCLSTAAETLTWKNATAALPRVSTPLGSDSNPFYTVTCLDAAQDVKARIRIIVRDWDKSFRIDSDIFNQSYTAPPVNMNNNNPDPIFGIPYNNKADWDDIFNGAAATFTPLTCAAQTATTANCSTITGLFTSDSECTSIGGVVAAPAAACSDPAYTTYVSCVSAGTCSNPIYTDAGSCAENTETWTPETWTPRGCTFANQNQCEYYGGTWTGSEQYKFPNDALGNLLGL